MKIPLKIKLFDRLRKIPRFIIIHDVSCQAPEDPALRIDNKKPQMNLLRTRLYLNKMEPDVNYHFVLEEIGEEFEVNLGRPMGVACNYPDIPSQYVFAFHVCVMGNYDYAIPSIRLYEKLCYSVLAPLIYQFKIPMKRIFLHNELVKGSTCPGSFFDINMVRSKLPQFLITK